MLGALPAAVLGFFPAAFCPACYPALAGLFSSLGLGALAGDSLRPLTVVLLAVAIAGLAYGARRTKRWLAVALGGLGALAMYAGIYWVASVPIKWAGIASLIAASIWNVAPAKSVGETAGGSCPACETKGGNKHGKA